MKKLLLLSAFAATFSAASAQTTLFQDNFESYDDFIISGIGQYKLFDNDGSATYIGGLTATPGVLPWPNAYAPMVGQIFNPLGAGVQNGHDGENSNFDPHGGEKYFAFWSATTPPNNDWLVLPKINLATGNKFSFWVKSLADDYGLEKYTVAIYDGTAGSPANSSGFQLIGGTRTAPLAWTEVTVDIPASYNGKAVYLALHYVSSDVYMMMVDDIKVTATTLGVNDAAAKNKTAVFPNPSTGVFNLKSSKKVSSVDVYAVDGKKIVQEEAVQAVDLTKQPKGVYILKVNYEDGSTDSQQVIKK